MNSHMVSVQVKLSPLLIIYDKDQNLKDTNRGGNLSKFNTSQQG